MRALLQLTLDLFSDVISASQKVHETEAERQQGEGRQPHALSSIVAQSEPPQTLSQAVDPQRFTHPRANREALLRRASGTRMGHAGGECVVAYELKRRKRQTIGFAIGADGLVVSAPRWVPLREIDKAVEEKAAWILSKLVQMQEREQRISHAQIQWREGASVPFMGESAIIVLDPRQLIAANTQHTLAQLHCDETSLPGLPRLTLHIGLPQDASPDRIRDCVQAWLMRQARRLFEERLNHFAPQLGVRWTKLSLSNASGRWGSAGSDGAIRLNWRLIHFSQSVIDYVVVHELSHLRVMDHSPRFWTTVESVMPDYSERKAQLCDEVIPRW